MTEIGKQEIEFMQNRYTKQAEGAIRYAAASAKKLRHPYIGTEHLLLGLRKEYTGVAGQVLAQHGVDEEKILKLMDELIAPEEEGIQGKRPKESPRFHYIMEDSAREAGHFHMKEIGTEHILIGLLKEGTGVAAQVLNDNGVELDKVMQLIEELIAPDAQVLTAEAKEYSPRALQVLEGAAREAARFHAEEIGTEHILFAILRDVECVATRLLHTLGVNLQKLCTGYCRCRGTSGGPLP